MGITVRIFIKTDHVAQDGTVPIYLGITVNGKARPPINLDQRVPVRPVDYWSVERRSVKESLPGADTINAILLERLSTARTIIQKYKVLKRALTYEVFLKEMDGLNVCDFYVHAEEFRAGLIGEKSESYIAKVGYIIDKIREFRPVLDLNDIDYKFIKDYRHHLVTKRQNKKNTIYSNFKIFRKILEDAVRQEKIKRNPFDNFRLQTEKVIKEPLTLDEVKKYEQLLDFKLPYYLHKTLCWWLLAIYTGRRYGDLLEFDKWIIKDDYMRLEQVKTVDGVQDRKVIVLFINDRIRRVLDLIRKNDYKPLSNKKANDFLKELTELTGIEKHTHFHLARHTFNKVNKQLKTEAVIRKELLGHESFRSTAHYEKPDEDLMREAMMKWNGA
jgi:integrase/recombinase XerD